METFSLQHRPITGQIACQYSVVTWKHLHFRDFLEFWEDDEEIRIGGRAGMVHLPCEGDESEDGDRVSFPRRGKRNVVSFHFTELIFISRKWRFFHYKEKNVR